MFPPPAEEDIAFTGAEGDGGHIEAEYISGAPAGCNIVFVQYRGAPTGGDWNQTAFLIANSPGTFASGWSGNFLDCRAAFGNDSQGILTDWGPITEVEIP